MKSFLIIFCCLFINITLYSQGSSLDDIVPKPKLAYYKVISAMFGINNNTAIVLNSEYPQYSAAYFLNNKLKEQYVIDTCKIYLDVPPENYSNLIYLGVCDNKINDMLSDGYDQPYEVDKSTPGKEGYILDVIPVRILINASDSEGLINAIRTLSQTLLPGDATTFLRAYRIIDVPDYSRRWVYYPTNFLVGANTTAAKSQWKQWADWKINAVNLTDYKFDFISTQPKRYFDSLSSANKFAKANYLDIIPSTMSWGYSNGMMFFNPNFATGLQVKWQQFVVEADTAKLIPTVKTTLPNGDFEKYNGNTFSGFLFIDGAGTQSFVDNTVYKTGKASIRFENFNGSNERVCYRTKVSPFKEYLISGWIKTENASPAGDIRLTVLNNKGQTLNYANLNVPATTNGWKKIDVIVNSLLGDTMTVYWGLWGAQSGKIWWDDLKVEEAAFVNLVRREGAPLNVSHQYLDVVIREGIDYDTLVDKKLGAAAGWFGEFDTYHKPPTLKIKDDGMLNKGDTVFASYYHAITIYDGQVMVTMSDENLYKQVDREFRLLDSVLKAETYFMNHDELRVMNWDYGDQSRGISAKEILADNVQKSIDIIHKFNPTADVWDWSDMFDNFHNATKNYYLVNGDLTGVADLIPNSMGIVNWNSGKLPNSTEFFAGKGFRQISAPYYDTDQNSIRIWKEKAQGIENFEGMMYTTWSRNYNYVKHFAEYGWNHAPYITHTPLWGIEPNRKLSFEVQIKGDDMDSGWKLAKAKLYYRTDAKGNFGSKDLNLVNNYVNLEIDFGTDNTYMEYYIEATDNRGWSKRNPLENDRYYILGTPTSVQDENLENELKVIPNPAGEYITVNMKPSEGSAIQIYNTLGELVLTVGTGRDLSARIDISSLSKGLYVVKVGTKMAKFIKM
jgi:hypothetical protein